MTVHLTEPPCHAHDPESSFEAAARHRDSGGFDTNLALVIAAVTQRPGLSAKGLERHIPGMNVYEIRRRLSDARARGLVEARNGRTQGRETSELVYYAAGHFDHATPEQMVLSETT